MSALKSIVGFILLFIIANNSQVTSTLNDEAWNGYNTAIRKLLQTNYSRWINAGTVLPRKDRAMGVVYLNNTFYLFGGYNNDKQLVTINNQNQHTDHGTNVLMTSLRSGSHCYSQFSDTSIVYYIEYLGASTNTRRIVIYDLESTNENGQIYADKNIFYLSCMTIAADILFITGGYDWDIGGLYVNTTQAYNITNSTWIVDIQDMKTKRAYHACVFDPTQEQIWVIGGWDGTDYSKSIETILTHEIASNDWQYSDELITSTSGHSAVYYKGYILALGGWNNNDGYLDTVQIINCDTRHVFMAGSLNYAVYYASAILITDKLYLFGGYNGSAYFNTMQYLNLDHELQYVKAWEPTQSPSYHPTEYPTQSSQSPTTSKPIFHPTEYPTQSPTTFTSNISPATSNKVSDDIFSFWPVLIETFILCVMFC